MEILNSLGINPTAVVWHAVNFLVLLWILQRFLYRPVLKMLDERAARIRESITHAESIQEERQRVQEESERMRAEAWQHAQNLLADANRSAEAILAEARHHAREETDLLIERARAEIERERDQVFHQLREQVAELAVAAASRVIQRSLDDAGHRDLIHQFLATEGNGKETSSAPGPS